MNTDTIRLYDRLELRPHGVVGNYDLIRDGAPTATIAKTTADALIEACNPPRYDLPPGVEQTTTGKFYAPGDVVRTLPDEMWTAYYSDGQRLSNRNAHAVIHFFFEVRPTAANPLPVLPPNTFRIPDGRLCCRREHAQALRDQGATILNTAGLLALAPDAVAPNPGHDQVVEVRFPEPPKTERVPWWEAKGRTSPNGYEITDVEWRKHQDHPFFYAKQGWKHADADGTVEVLVEGDAS